jgi:N-acetylmuramoyl-L-alanine amidase
MTIKSTLLCLLAALVVMPAAEAQAQSAKTLYDRALARERELRDGDAKPSVQQLRAAVAAYERIVRRFPASAYSDNALWQAGNLALLAFDDFGQAADRATGVRLLSLLRTEYPSSSLRARAAAVIKEREAAPPAVVHAAPRPAAQVSETPPVSRPSSIAIRDVKRSELPDGTRVTIELDGEVMYHSERVENPKRVFFDLKNARPGAALQDATLKFDDALVREVRLGRHPNATRVVMNMEGAESYSVFTLYDPFRIVVDFKRSAANAPQPLPPARTEIPAADPAAAPPSPPKAVATAPRPTPAQQADSPAPAEAVPVPTTSAPAVPPPVPPSANIDGKFSLSRQLGLGVARIVIDAGHGGHDPGAKANGVTEAELTLDVATRLKKLLDKQPGIEVVMTRSTDVFIPLEERTRIANREGADLFLSIHANASRNVRARGVETYFLNFATNSEAEAVAARENAGSGQTMHKLPEIVRAIATNNKIDESRDFAEIVQRAMVRRLSQRNKSLRDIGVKQAPFVVLIGAEMPSVLAEMSFVTNKQDAALLKTGAYRQQIAEALLDAVVRYQQSLKKMRSAGTAQTSSR